ARRRRRARAASTCVTRGHQETDLLALRVRGGERADDASPIYDEDAVREVEHLVQLGRHEQDRDALVAPRDDLLVNELDAAHVEPARRLIEDEQLQVGVEL